MEVKSATVVGLGLIGGSLAKALRRVGSIREVIGIDTNQDTLDNALAEGVVDKAYTDINKGLDDTDIVFICTPVDKIADRVRELVEVVKPGCIITDTGSIKSKLIKHIDLIHKPLNFIGGHPMCGSEKSGYSESKAHLFENAYYILIPCSKTHDKTVSILEKIIIEIGGIPVIIDSIEHDVITGAISHVPHIVSAALVNLVREMDGENKHMQRLAAGGFKDITRISSSNPQMWQNIVLNNREQINVILEKFSEIINKFSSWIESEEPERIFDYFNSAKKYRDTFTSKNVGLLLPFYDISVDMEDKPGELGKLTTLLGENRINIKNINITNSREFDHGCLRITFPDAGSMDNAVDLLELHGYTVTKLG